MTLDYDSHPSELKVKGMSQVVTVDDLRKEIPPHCFRPSYSTSFAYLCRDFMVAGALFYSAWAFIPHIEYQLARYAGWALYGYIQGLAWTGIWWKSTHRRHHNYANNLAKDHNYVPPQRERYASSLMFSSDKLEELTEDVPIVTFLRIVLQQVIGFPWYLLTNITASPGSLYRNQAPSFLGNSHFLPTSTLFRPEEAHLIMASDIGIGLAAYGLYAAGLRIGFLAVALLYIQPYMWVNHWIVAITYCQTFLPYYLRTLMYLEYSILYATALFDAQPRIGTLSRIFSILGYLVITYVYKQAYRPPSQETGRIYSLF
ncbi:delta-12 fatty acid desaturas-like protein [Botryosphaeria dothidea]|uniref:Delta-12 fatty acid desaturas-like protein n=1 Tax=Botryosphaeria dothidea TaxID=55169 RepID=A0A8H4J464_9PEZI|nr:delta-12 fatty acid desaturas-like protein [Botryosphaeria dothidea]